MTLIELLVVMAIMAIIAGVAVRQMQPALDGRRIREAARAVNVYLGAARNHALATGRPCGVLLRRFSDDLPQCSMVLEQVEEPLPYGGDTLSAVAQLQIVSPNLQATLAAGEFNDSLINVGDLVQFNNQGPFYRIDAVNTNVLTLSLANPAVGQTVPWPTASSWSVPYKIFRQPRKTAAGPLQLPAGAVVDMTCSGTDAALFGATPAPVIIMFSPNGSVARCYVDNTAYPVIEPIYLMIGKREKILPVAANEENWRDFDNLWVTISPRTGMVTSAEVAAPAGSQFPADIAESREFAREAQGMGGR